MTTSQPQPWQPVVHKRDPTEQLTFLDWIKVSTYPDDVWRTQFYHRDKSLWTATIEEESQTTYGDDECDYILTLTSDWCRTYRIIGPSPRRLKETALNFANMPAVHYNKLTADKFSNQGRVIAVARKDLDERHGPVSFQLARFFENTNTIALFPLHQQIRQIFRPVVEDAVDCYVVLTGNENLLSEAATGTTWGTPQETSVAFPKNTDHAMQHYNNAHQNQNSPTFRNINLND